MPVALRNPLDNGIRIALSQIRNVLGGSYQPLFPRIRFKGVQNW